MPRKQLKANAPRHKAAPERDLAVVPEESRLAVEDARKEFAHTLNLVAYGGERIILARRGRDLAALVPVEDFKLLEDLEDRLDLQAARKALAEAELQGSVPWAKLKKDLGL